MVLGHNGKLDACSKSYDKTVVGVISGAGGLAPAVVLDKDKPSAARQPIAMLGKVYCKVSAQYAAIEAGDLLTTSPTPGHAMKADDPARAFGAVLGKALQPLSSGEGLIPIIVTLH